MAALSHSARPILVEAGADAPILVLQAAYQFHLEKLREPASKAAVEWALYQVLSQPLRVRLTLRSDTEGGTTGGGRESGRAAESRRFQVRPSNEPDALSSDPTPDNVIPMRRPSQPSGRDQASRVSHRSGPPRGRGTGRPSDPELAAG